MNEIKPIYKIILLIILLWTVCSGSLIGRLIQDMIKLSSINDYRDSIATKNLLKLGECPKSTFQCDSNLCIRKNKLCDGNQDCPNNSDEELRSCLSYMTNAIESIRIKRENMCDFLCNSGECLQSIFVCDGFPDCLDGSDETEEICHNVQCSSFLFRCKYGACISKDKVCDGKPNCADNSDEETPECPRSRIPGVCRSYEFRCLDGECIDKINACDGFKNCADGSDETTEACADVVCSNYLFKCNYGACVEGNARCNNVEECADGSDEIGCDISVSLQVPLRNESSGCQLPRHPARGKYEIISVKTYFEGTYVSSGTKLNLKCPLGYVSFRLFNSTCLHNTWYPSLDQSKCLRTCPYLDPLGKYVVYCSWNKRFINCNNSVEGTEADVTCKSFSANNANVHLILVCLSNGSWSQELQPCETPVINASCILPQHPLHGKYKFITGNDYRENASILPYTADARHAIMLTCDSGYVAQNDLIFFYCNNTKWVPKLKKNACLRTCPSLHDTPSYEVRCELYGQSTICENPVVETKAKLICKPYYKYHSVIPILFCQDGKWDPYPTPCQPECGQKNVNVETLIIGGNNATESEYPWVVAIYNSSRNNEQICSGSIISRHYVLSAAHCFTNNKGMPYNKDFYSIIAGKYYRDFYKEENGTQIRKIRNLSIHEDYRGSLHSYRNDIALIEVNEPFVLTEKVQLVCTDWDKEFELQDFQENTKAVVVGWGLTKENAIPSEVLKKLIVPYRSVATCKKHLDKGFSYQFYVSDKFCAGYYGKSTSVCSGDSGGGLYFQSLETRYFIRGIVSLSPQSTVGCSSNHYALYTKVSTYMTWITKKTRRIL